MKQLRFKAQDFSGLAENISDAHIDQRDLLELKKLAGLSVNENDDTSGRMSPLGSNISHTAAEKKQIEKEHNIKPGTPEWFQLWFSRPYLTGEPPYTKNSKK